MAYQLRSLATAEDLSSLPSVSHISANSQLPITPTSGDPMLSSGLCRHTHACAHTCTDTHTHTNNKNIQKSLMSWTVQFSERMLACMHKTLGSIHSTARYTHTHMFTRAHTQAHKMRQYGSLSLFFLTVCGTLQNLVVSIKQVIFYPIIF